MLGFQLDKPALQFIALLAQFILNPAVAARETA
jgi:hypothetical protein